MFLSPLYDMITTYHSLFFLSLFALMNWAGEDPTKCFDNLVIALDVIRFSEPCFETAPTIQRTISALTLIRKTTFLDLPLTTLGTSARAVPFFAHAHQFFPPRSLPSRLQFNVKGPLGTVLRRLKLGMVRILSQRWRKIIEWDVYRCCLRDTKCPTFKVIYIGDEPSIDTSS